MAIFEKNVQQFKEEIDKEFSIKDIGPAELLLGVKIHQMDGCITLYQQHFVDSLLDLYDADWGNCRLTQRSTSGYLAQLHGCLICWKTRKQPLVSISTAEAEYKLLCDLTSELLWFQKWCQEADIFHFNNAITVWEDNQSCIKTANGNCNLNTKRMKHVEIQLHFVKEAIKNQLIELSYTPTLDMLADFLTKAVPKLTLHRALEALGVLRLGLRGGVEKQSHQELRLVPSQPKTPKTAVGSKA
ncbi:hypothetical protein O181_005310 [Austropuccinia psidii MF-1]|uniref:Reverse transcriptase Ty1/copia-type domain-containing protein n=1 Tax=Austropuccinia psidii MF-1 TaxID=1389203 RepID=A0A9Q3GFQ3_9BASI|nr:hypothetical protein [Austropuccinia psidii MF-1]